MPFSIRCGLTLLCLTMLPLLRAQVLPPYPGPVGSHRLLGCCGPVFNRARIGPSPDCCMEASKHAFNEPVTACFRQEKNPFQGCVSTYVFHTMSNHIYCVDPEAWWIPQRLQRLEQRGIHCRTL